MLACPPEAEEVFLRAALLAESLADKAEAQGEEETAEQQREVAAKVRSLLPQPS